MGKMNLLKADFTGKVAQTYGYRKKKKSIIAAVPFSHSPHNEKQKDQWTAFTTAQKLNGVIAKSIFRYTGLSDKKVNKINAVATALKQMTKDGIYIPTRIKSTIKNTDTMHTQSVKNYKEGKKIEITIENNNISDESKKEIMLIILFNEAKQVLEYKTKSIETGVYKSEIEYESLPCDYIIILKCVYIKKEWQMVDGDCIYMDDDIVEEA